MDRNKKEKILKDIIRPLKTASYEIDLPWCNFNEYIQQMSNDYGGLEMDPDFQRGHVWTPDQQKHFVENVLRGIVSSSGFVVQFNCPNWESFSDYAGDLPRGFQCIDGLQRITAVQKFLEGEVKPFGLSLDDLQGSSFSPKRSLYRFKLAIHNFEKRSDLLSHYLDINSGGTPHSPEEIERIRVLYQASLENADQDAILQAKPRSRP